MNTRPVMIHWVEDGQCVLEAIHLACALARSDGTSVVLVKMAPVQHIGWLGSELGHCQLTAAEREFLTTFETIGQDYEIPVGVIVFQYATLLEGLIQAAEYIKAQAVFTRLPQNIFPPWRKFLNWQLQRQLSSLECEFYNLDGIESQSNWTPSALIPVSRKPVYGSHK